MVVVRKAVQEDLDDVAKIYEHIHVEEERGAISTGWIKNIYPVRKTATDSFERNDLFVMQDEGKTVAAAIINKVQVPCYIEAAWKHRAEKNEVMVLHTLVVEPSEKRKGYGKSFVAFYEAYAEKNGCRELRMDTNAVNLNARAMYRKLGYEEIGIVSCEFNGIPNVRLVCLEKYIGCPDCRNTVGD